MHGHRGDATLSQFNGIETPLPPERNAGRTSIPPVPNLS